jgi:hypothetical protein
MLLKKRFFVFVPSCFSLVAFFSGCGSATDGPTQAAASHAAAKTTAGVSIEKPAEPQGAVVEPAAKIGSNAAATIDAPKVSTFAPAEDLAAQLDWYLNDLEKAVASEDEYKDSADKVAKEANTVVIIALALGLHDEDNQYKASAAALLKAAKDLAVAKDFASAQKGVAALKDAADGKGNGGDVALAWAPPSASLPELMKQVPTIHTKLKLRVKGASFKKKAKETAGYTAVIAAIAQGTMSDASAAKGDDQIKSWQAFSAAMRDAAGSVNAAIRKGDEPAAAESMKTLQKSCDDCHTVFHPAALELN